MDAGLVASLTQNAPHYDFGSIVQMEQVRVKYGEALILDGIDWLVRPGEKWALLGPNGSGKSTLLSLITADNPQSYANKIYLFDKKEAAGKASGT